MSNPTRRSFLYTTGVSAVTAGITQWTGCSMPGRPQEAIQGAPGFEFLTPPERPPDYSHDLERDLTRVANELWARRRRELEAIRTPDAVRARQKALRAQLWEMLGGPFEKTPLNPRVNGTLERPGYRVEKLIYESRPQLYVTANLYLPDGRPGRLPAVLGPLGHSQNGKAWRMYQRLFINLARKGYVVLAFDPFGQGERIEYPGPRPGESLLGGGTSEHEHAGRRLILLGVNFSLFRAWDGIRGIDYLLTRPEVDPQRIGCCGQSGGGTMTQFLAALDDRIRAAVVSQGNTENIAQANVEPPGSADDAEQNIVPSLARGVDRSDLLHIFAPRPLLMTVTTHDAANTYSPEYISGTLETLEELRRTYGLLGAADRLALEATAHRHGYVYEMRRATYRWFNKWLNNSGADDEEPETKAEPDEALLVTKTGFVTTSLGGETALSLTRKLADQVHPEKKPSSREDLISRVRRVLALPDRRDDLTPRVLCRVKKFRYTAEQFEFSSDGEMRTPGWLMAPEGDVKNAATILYLSEAPAASALAEEGTAEQLCLAGFRVCAIDLRGRGDCSPAYPPRGPHYFAYRMNESYLNWFTLVLARPLFGGQVFDALRAAEYLRNRPEIAADKIWLLSDGPHGLAALHVLALDENVHGAVIGRGLTDYRSLAVSDRYKQPFGIYLYGVLREFDLPDVAAACTPRPLLLLDPTGAEGDPVLPAVAVSTYYQGAQKAYAAAGTEARFAVQASSEQVPFVQGVVRWLRANG
ncbi:MAG: acetylxylan esterase [Acidobacteria bacterium]|nr:acetylxylan esterase [Acidobacteriota bacterium]